MTDSAVPAVMAPQSLKVLLILSVLMAFASISTDVYLPALPVMAGALGASPGRMELTVSSYLIGFSLGQLLWGPIGDRLGRRGPIAVGLLLFIVGSAGCALSDSAASMIAWRVVQAVGGCASVVLARAMVRDLYAGPQAARMMSTLMTIMAIAPLVGPSVGGLILHLGSWRAIFWCLALIALATLISLKSLPETLHPARRNRQKFSQALANYGRLLGHGRLLCYIGSGGFFYAGVYAYVAGTPFAYIDYHHLAPQYYGLLFALGIVGIMLTNQLNARLVERLGSDALIRVGATMTAVAGVSVVFTAWTGFGGLAGLVVPLLVYVAANGFIVANSIAGAMSRYPQQAGAVSALTGALQYGSGILGSGLVGLCADGTPWPMGWVIGVAGLGCLACALLLGVLARRAQPGLELAAG
ncbi:MAG: Bicyclomycin resistance protein [Stenotrophomonas maltophilia]|nr:MAG: Bicyclomycin resistance protein [Stenotrophomonas maltophilia]